MSGVTEPWKRRAASGRPGRDRASQSGVPPDQRRRRQVDQRARVAPEQRGAEDEHEVGAGGRRRLVASRRASIRPASGARRRCRRRRCPSRRRPAPRTGAAACSPARIGMLRNRSSPSGLGVERRAGRRRRTPGSSRRRPRCPRSSCRAPGSSQSGAWSRSNCQAGMSRSGHSSGGVSGWSSRPSIGRRAPGRRRTAGRRSGRKRPRRRPRRRRDRQAGRAVRRAGAVALPGHGQRLIDDARRQRHQRSTSSSSRLLAARRVEDLQQPVQRQRPPLRGPLDPPPQHAIEKVPDVRLYGSRSKRPRAPSAVARSPGSLEPPTKVVEGLHADLAGKSRRRGCISSAPVRCRGGSGSPRPGRPPGRRRPQPAQRSGSARAGAPGVRRGEQARPASGGPFGGAVEHRRRCGSSADRGLGRGPQPVQWFGRQSPLPQRRLADRPLVEEADSCAAALSAPACAAALASMSCSSMPIARPRPPTARCRGSCGRSRPTSCRSGRPPTRRRTPAGRSPGAVGRSASWSSSFRSSATASATVRRRRRSG